MTASRFAAPVRCAACQRFVLEQLTGISLRRSTLPGHQFARRPLFHQRNLHSAVPRQLNSALQQSGNDSHVDSQAHDDVDKTVEEETAEDQPPPNDAQTGPSTPWYLRNYETSTEIDPFAHKQRLPALPKDPPPVLEPLLKHLSVDIGLDYLSLIDLREVDPPPAFGANLYMIFGTARSEKHLNVSADRLCRWLRSEYKLTPYADGLLGRQELKLKLRRKARRTRMLSAAGASNASSLQLDDGTRTGWVCVSVGDVEAPANPTDQKEMDKNFVGFGARSNSAKIVIQMLVEEKRVELDLENLWQGILKGSIKRQHEAESDASPAPSSSLTERDGHNKAAAGLTGAQQTRAFHSSARTLHAEKALPENQVPVESSTSSNWAIDAADRLMITDPDLVVELAELRALLGRNPVRDVLGVSEHDQSSTDFLRRFFSKMPPFRSLDHWNAHLILHRMGMDAGHQGYTSEHQWKILKDMDDSCIDISPETFAFVFDNVMVQKSARITPVASVAIKDYKAVTSQTHNMKHLQRYSPHFTTVEKHLHMAFDTLERMESHRQAPLPLEFFLGLHASLSQPSKERFTNRERSDLQLRYYNSLKLIFPADEPLPQSLVLDMLRTWAQQASWRNFWILWRDFAVTGFRRDGDMYAALFESIGANYDQPVSRRVITEWVPEMSKEKPAVEIDDKIALGILRCLRNLGFHPQGDEGLVRLYGSLWDKCWALVEPKYEALSSSV